MSVMLREQTTVTRLQFYSVAVMRLEMLIQSHMIPLTHSCDFRPHS